jgi:hypothetical protein
MSVGRIRYSTNVIRTQTLEAADRRGTMNVLPHELPSCACIYNADLARGMQYREYDRVEILRLLALY